MLRELEAKFGHMSAITKGSERNVTVGLTNDADELLGIKIIERIDYERKQVTVLTPVKNAGEVAAVQFGSMGIKPDGVEIGTIKPGTF
jgi:polynucleotide 5'-kinase involved in rRNA processing